MITPDKIDAMISEAVNELNSMRPQLPPVALDFDKPLFGPEGQVDSLGLVNLIVALEQQVETELGISITLASERTMSQRNSPFRTLATLRDFTVMLLQEAQA